MDFVANELEFVLVLLMLVCFFCLFPLLRMLLGTGPNSFRRLVRLDLAAFFVMTAGVALALGVTRAITWREGRFAAAIVMLILLPAGLAASWFGRFLIEDLSFHFGKSRRRTQQPDLSGLGQEPNECDGAENPRSVKEENHAIDH